MVRVLVHRSRDRSSLIVTLDDHHSHAWDALTGRPSCIPHLCLQNSRRSRVIVRKRPVSVRSRLSFASDRDVVLCVPLVTGAGCRRWGGLHPKHRFGHASTTRAREPSQAPRNGSRQHTPLASHPANLQACSNATRLRERMTEWKAEFRETNATMERHRDTGSSGRIDDDGCGRT